MIEEFKHETWHDFQARYQGTYGWYQKASGQKLLVTLTEVEERSCRFVDADGGVFTALSDKGNNFQFLPVKRGVYRTSKGLVYCRRIPAKQYKRGIASGNTHIEQIGGGRLSIDFTILAEMFGDTDYKEVENFKNGERFDAQFNNAFVIDLYRVWLYNNQIGIRRGSRLVLSTPLFKQEVEDIVASNGLEMSVEIA